jgi:ribosomal protein S18 acetylase RimI-like enzyme
MQTSELTVTHLSAEDLDRRLPDFGALLHACVHAGASIGFVLPFAQADAEAFWRETVRPAVARGGRTLLAAEVSGRLAGTVQLDTGTPPNQPHRAEVTKLLVHPEFRRRGIARVLMAELERQATIKERSLITLDTRSEDAAEPLYLSLGFVPIGRIPGWAVDPIDPAKFDPTTFMYKTL